MPDEAKSREMAARGRIGALVTLSRHDAREITRPAREAFRAKFAAEVDPENVLSPADRAERAEFARRAFYARIARKSALARSRRGRSAPEAA